MSRELESKVKQLRQQVREMRQQLSRLPLQIAPVRTAAGSGGDGAIWGRLTEATQDGANRRWVYTFVQVSKGEPAFGSPGWNTVDGGEAGEARNLMEAMNGTSGMTGIGLTVEEIEDGTCPFEMQPIVTGSSGLVVRMWPVVVLGGGEEGEDITEWWFSIPNSVKPTE